MTTKRVHFCSYNLETHRARGIHRPPAHEWQVAVAIEPGTPTDKVISALKSLIDSLKGTAQSEVDDARLTTISIGDKATGDGALIG